MGTDHALKIEVHRIRGSAPFGAARLGGDQLGIERAGEASDNLVLRVQEIGHRLVETFGPQMRAGLRLDQLNVDPHPISATLHAALEQIAHVQFAADLLDVGRLALVGEGGAPADDECAVNARQVGSQALGHAVDEIVLLGPAADVGEGENDDRQTRRNGSAGRRRGRRRAGPNHVDPHRPRDVLQRLFAQIDEGIAQPVANLLIGRGREAHGAGLANTLQSRRDVDAVAHQIAVALFDHVADMNADAEDNAPVLRHAGVALDHGGLDFDRAADGVDRAAELDEASVAHALDDPTVVNGDRRVD